MTSRLEFLRLDQVDDFIRCLWASTDAPGNLYTFTYPKGLQADLWIRLRNRLHSALQTDGKARFFCTIDSESHTMTSVSYWGLPQAAKNVNVDAKVLAAQKALAAAPVDGANDELALAVTQATAQSEHEICGDRPHLALNTIATHPLYQRRGLANLHMEWGTKEADRLGVPLYLMSSNVARPLYERWGFSVVKVLPVDDRDFGAESASERYCMLREAQAIPAIGK